MENCIVLIDLGYLSFISKFFGKGEPLRYKIESFAVNLAKEKNLLCKEIYLYLAPPFQNPVPTKQENKRKANYDKFISKLKKVQAPTIHIREGRCQKIGTIYQQKGVDTLITMDLVKLSSQEKIKKAILITSDSDFVPILEDIKKNSNLEVILAYFTDKKRKSAFSLSNHLWNVCPNKMLIRKEHFR